MNFRIDRLINKFPFSRETVMVFKKKNNLVYAIAEKINQKFETKLVRSFKKF